MKLSSILAIALAGALMSSCSLYNSITGKADTDKQGATSTSTVKPVTVKPDKKKGKKKKGDKDVAERTELKAGQFPTTDQLLGAQWNITGVGDNVIYAEDNTPYIVFDDKGRFYAGDGCNIVNGDYVLRSNGKMAFSSVLSTMKYCPDVAFAPLVAEAISDGKTYNVDCRRIGQETYLYLKDDKGRTVVTLRRHNMEFLNGNWLIKTVEGVALNDEEATLFIDIPELKVHGNTGCNYFNGDLYIEPSRSNAIDFSNMGLTRMACPKGDQERRIMVALEQTTTAIAGKNADTVLLLDGAGKELMTLKRIPMDTDNQ